jgi:hypothetical protein
MVPYKTKSASSDLLSLSDPESAAMGVNFSSLHTFLAVVAAFMTRTYIRRRNSFVSQLQGPKSHSFWIGEYQKYCLRLCGVLCEHHTNPFPVANCTRERRRHLPPE